jgi:RNA polymerase sigma factor (sigma-70 family)
MTDSKKLLADYVQNGSEAAFRDLVTRYTDLVYSTAFRLVDGDTQLAQDVAQTVFIDLARMGRTFSGEVMLGGWLHRHTRFMAASLLRSERRRKSRERQAAEMNTLQDEPDGGLKQVSIIIDEVIDGLANEDRAAIILRFFEGADLRSVGEALGIGENAARMRVSRALEKLHVLLKRRGATLSATALATALAAEAVSAAPAGMAINLAATALSAGVAGGGFTLTLLKTVAMTKLKIAVLTVVAVVGLTIPMIRHHQSLTKLRNENSALRSQLDDLARLTAENQRLTNLLSQPTGSSQEAQTKELLKLRGEIGRLKRQIAETSKERQTAVAVKADPKEVQREIAIANMVYTKGWVLAFRLYADRNQGQFPTNFESAASFLPDESKSLTNWYTTDQFEIVYEGSIDAITNPASIIVVREKEPWQVSDGGWVRGYAFADGHSEIHKAVDGDFQPWESAHLWSPPAAGLNQ